MGETPDRRSEVIESSHSISSRFLHAIGRADNVTIISSSLVDSHLVASSHLSRLCRPSSSRSTGRMASETQSFTLPSGRPMAYTLSPAEDPSDRVVLLSNSLAADSSTWDRVAYVIHDQGFRVLRYDNPGHGQSGVPSESEISSMTFDILADEVYYLLQHLGITRLHAWIGNSMGGVKGVYFVARHPGIVNKLVVVDSIASSPAVAGVADPFASRVSAAKEAGTLSQDLLNTRKRWFGEDWMAANPDETERIEKSMATTTVPGFEACCRALGSPSFDLRPLYPMIGKGSEEALMVVGENDGDLPSKMQDMQKAIEESLRGHGKKVPVQMEVVKSAGHVPYVDNFEDFCISVIRFLHR